MLTIQREVTEEQIARRAYEIWESRGCPECDGREDWEAAEAELRGGMKSNGSSEGDGSYSWLARVRRKFTGHDE